MNTLLPHGFSIRLSERTRVCDGGASLVGGARGGVVYLGPEARGRIGADGLLVVADDTDAALAAALLDGGYADPDFPPSRPSDDLSTAVGGSVTLVVPVHGRAEGLARLLRALPSALAVIVVDDASPDPRAIAALARAHGARLVRLERNAGPAAARNAGLALAGTALVAFCDSDVVPEPGWLATLARHFADPGLAVVAPRVLGPPRRGVESVIERYEQARSSLDLGDRPGPVRPGTPVAYLPAACLLARRGALGGGFDESMRCGEDVDLIWRLVAAGWRVRYDPAAAVRHDHRTRPWEWLRRKAFYGTSAGPLAARHGDAVAPLALTAWSGAFTVALLAQRRWSLPLAALIWGAATVRVAGRLHRSGRPLLSAAALTVQGAVAGPWQVASAMTRHHWPLALLAAAHSRRARRALLVSAVVEALVDRRRTRADLDPVRYLVARRLDDVAYGAGLWWGVLHQISSPRTGPGRARWPAVQALLPALRRSGPSARRERVTGSGHRFGPVPSRRVARG